MNRTLLPLLCAVALGATAQPQPLVIHEWGTFTSLQDEAGRTLSGINSDDEPVPAFVHGLNSFLILPDSAGARFSKGVARSRPDVTMRLETPVVYFHPPKDAALPLTVDFKVSFRGGLLAEFFPLAQMGDGKDFNKITPATVGSLTWNRLKIGTAGTGPKTTERVWLAPRAVTAAAITATNGESEKFLFYRGIGNLNSPLQAKRSADGQTLALHSQLSIGAAALPPMKIRQLWLASFSADGKCAFRSLPEVTLGGNGGAALLKTPANFAPADYSKAALQQLRTQMHAALRADGMFADEADALLNTWELSYFKSGGLRLFFTVPRDWTDLHLPMEVSVPAEIKRAMIGRIELVTPAQRSLMSELASAVIPLKAQVMNGIAYTNYVPNAAVTTAYRDLGRFRSALLLHEIAQRPTESLKTLAQVNGLPFAQAAPAAARDPARSTTFE